MHVIYQFCHHKTATWDKIVKGHGQMVLLSLFPRLNYTEAGWRNENYLWLFGLFLDSKSNKRLLTLLMRKHCMIHTVFFFNSKPSTWQIRHLNFLVKLLERDELNNFAQSSSQAIKTIKISKKQWSSQMIGSTIKLKTNPNIKPTFWDTLDLWSLPLFDYILVGWGLQMAFFGVTPLTCLRVN